jgi:hypothetical protein
MDNVQVSFLGSETRPAFMLNDVKGADLFNIKAQPSQSKFSFVFDNVANIKISGSDGIRDQKIDKVKQLNL